MIGSGIKSFFVRGGHWRILSAFFAGFTINSWLEGRGLERVGLSCLLFITSYVAGRLDAISNDLRMTNERPPQDRPSDYKKRETHA